MRGNTKSKTVRPDDNAHAPLKTRASVVDFVLSHGGRTSEAADHRPAVRRPTKPRKRSIAKSPLRFIDLFCGIGGFRLAFERTGAKCVFSSDWDKFSRQTYAANFGEVPHGDINSIPIADIPPFDILCGGFPCQPFSLPVVSTHENGFAVVGQKL